MDYCSGDKLKLSGIILENVKSFKQRTEISFDEDLNILIGSNRGGKSNLLDIIIVALKREVIYNWVIQESNQGTPPRRVETVVHQRMFDPPGQYLEKYYGNDQAPQNVEIKIKVTAEDLEGLDIVRKNLEKLKEIETHDFLNMRVMQSISFDGTIPEPDYEFAMSIVNGQGIPPSRSEDKNFLTYTRNYELFSILIDKYNENVESANKINSLLPLFQYFSPNREAAFGSGEVKLAEMNKYEVVKEFSKNTSKQSEKTWNYISYYISMKMRNSGDDQRQFDNEQEIHNLNKVLKELGYDKLEVSCLNKQKNLYSINVREGDMVIPPQSMSSGEREVLNILFSVYAFGMKNGLLIIDEPELHIHVTWQRKMLRMMEEIRRDRKVQFIVVTHSPNFITRETLNKTFRIHRIKGESYIYKFNLSSGVSSQDQYRMIQWLGFQSVLFLDKVILVEGQTDRVIYGSLIETYYNAGTINDGEDIQVVDVGGKKNITKFMELLKSFKIDTYAVVDMDFILDEPEMKGCIEFNERKATDNLRKRDNKDGRHLSTLLEKFIEDGCKTSRSEDCDSLRELVEYIKNRYSKISANCEDKKENTIQKLREQKIFVLSKGEVENYFPDYNGGKFSLEEAMNTAQKIIKKEVHADTELERIIKQIAESMS